MRIFRAGRSFDHPIVPYLRCRHLYDSGEVNACAGQPTQSQRNCETYLCLHERTDYRAHPRQHDIELPHCSPYSPRTQGQVNTLSKADHIRSTKHHTRLSAQSRLLYCIIVLAKCPKTRPTPNEIRVRNIEVVISQEASYLVRQLVRSRLDPTSMGLHATAWRCLVSSIIAPYPKIQSFPLAWTCSVTKFASRRNSSILAHRWEPLTSTKGTQCRNASSTFPAASNKLLRSEAQLKDPWSPAEVQIVKDTQAQGLTVKGTANHLPKRTQSAVRTVIHQIRCGREMELYERLPPKDRIPWSTAEKQRIRELREQGATKAELCRAFPHRRFNAILHAFTNYSKNTTNGKEQNSRRRWTREEERYLAEAPSQGVSTLAIAQNLSRSAFSIKRKAQESGIHLCGTDYFTPEDDRILTQMRMDGCNNPQVAAVLGCTVERVRKRWRSIRPVAQFDLRPHSNTGGKILNADALASITRLRDEDKSWATVFGVESYGYASWATLARGYERAMKKMAHSTS